MAAISLGVKKRRRRLLYLLFVPFYKQTMIIKSYGIQQTLNMPDNISKKRKKLKKITQLSPYLLCQKNTIKT